jgi:hypothetical protein
MAEGEDDAEGARSGSSQRKRRTSWKNSAREATGVSGRMDLMS